MALQDHVAILLSHSLDVARLNKKKTKSDFYAQIALPPAAVADVAALVAEIYPGIPLGSIEVNFKTNANQKTPVAGVPGDWYILRMASQFAPELYAADGKTRYENATARSQFYAGMRVRVVGNAWAWKGDNGPAASFNLFGVMDAGVGGDRLAIGTGSAGNAFAVHGNPNAAPAPSVAQMNANAPVSAPNSANPFAQGGQAAQNAIADAAAKSEGNPFAQAAAPASKNPFA